MELPRATLEDLAGAGLSAAELVAVVIAARRWRVPGASTRSSEVQAGNKARPVPAQLLALLPAVGCSARQVVNFIMVARRQFGAPADVAPGYALAAVSLGMAEAGCGEGLAAAVIDRALARQRGLPASGGGSARVISFPAGRRAPFDRMAGNGSSV